LEFSEILLFWLFTGLTVIFALAALVAPFFFRQEEATVRRQKKVSYLFLVLTGVCLSLAIGIKIPTLTKPLLIGLLCLFLPLLGLNYFVNVHVFGMTARERGMISQYIRSPFKKDEQE